MLYDVEQALVPLLVTLRVPVDGLAEVVESLRVLSMNTATVILLDDAIGLIALPFCVN